jgi:AGZA family xanthine/uracil permease-like MFS transporter
MPRYRWAAVGDINAFFGLMLDNVANLVLMVALLATGFGFPATTALERMIPGTALGVLVGDLALTLMAFRLARRTGRETVTAMPLGIDTPSLIGMVFFVLGPAYAAALAHHPADSESAALHAWRIGMCAIVVSGIFKLVCAPVSGWVRRIVPRAGLLGSLTAIALVLISFLPLLDILEFPIVGLVSLAIVLTTLIAHVRFPFRIPGALGALLTGMAIYYLMHLTGVLGRESHDVAIDARWGLFLPLPTLDWIQAFVASLHYPPVVLPFALATVVGGIDCTESAAAAGDEYDTRQVIAVEGLATVVAGLCGGVIQTTPYIGHPAYKAMGGRAAYTLATAIFVAAAGIFGLFGYLYQVMPKAALFPILIFVGLEITAQSFAATDRRHFPAVALACVPAMAYLVMIFADAWLPASGGRVERLPLLDAARLQTVRVLSAGFIVTSLLWGSALAAIIDRQLRRAASFLAVAALCSLFGVIHSPLPGSPLMLPWDLPALPAAAAGQSPPYIAGGYAAMGLVLLAWSFWPGAVAGPPREAAETT